MAPPLMTIASVGLPLLQKLGESRDVRRYKQQLEQQQKTANLINALSRGRLDGPGRLQHVPRPHGQAGGAGRSPAAFGSRIGQATARGQQRARRCGLRAGYWGPGGRSQALGTRWCGAEPWALSNFWRGSQARRSYFRAVDAGADGAPRSVPGHGPAASGPEGKPASGSGSSGEVQAGNGAYIGPGQYATRPANRNANDSVNLSAAKERI